MTQKAKISDILVHKPTEGAIGKKFRVVDISKHFYICRDMNDKYTECFLKTDLGKEVFKA
jgi:hypothetical protein